MSIYDINGNEISGSGLSSPDFELLAGNGDRASFSWSQGTINNSTGADYASTIRVRTEKYYKLDSARYIFIHCPTGYKFRTAIYTAVTDTPTFNRITDFATGNQMLAFEDSKLYRFVLSRSDDAAFAPADIPSDFYVIPVFKPVWSASANGKSIGAFTTAHSNPDNVSEIVSVAETYWNNRNEYLNGRRVMVYGQSTIFNNDTYTNNIDCSTFVGLCLRGIPFDQTPYHTGANRNRNSYYANPEYAWSVNPFEFGIYGEANSRIRTVADIAMWMISQRREVTLDPKFVNVDAGDVVCFAKRDEDGFVIPHRFMALNHIGIVISKRRVFAYSSSKTYAVRDCVQYSGALYECSTAISTAEAWNSSHWTKIYDTWDVDVVPYVHEVMESINITPTINIRILENGWDTPTDFSNYNVNTLSLVCRPDLGSL